MKEKNAGSIKILFYIMKMSFLCSSKYFDFTQVRESIIMSSSKLLLFKFDSL